MNYFINLSDVLFVPGIETTLKSYTGLINMINC